VARRDGLVEAVVVDALDRAVGVFDDVDVEVDVADAVGEHLDRRADVEVGALHGALGVAVGRRVPPAALRERRRRGVARLASHAELVVRPAGRHPPGDGDALFRGIDR